MNNQLQKIYFYSLTSSFSRRRGWMLGVTGGLICAGLSLTSCRTIRPYEKEYLLHPTMDDARVDSLSGAYGKTKRPSERLASSGGGGGSSACPTCGGK
jgi:hypothetical protein